AVVGDLEEDLVLRAVEVDAQGLGGGAVLHGVAAEVRYDLGEAIGVPMADEIAATLELDVPLGVGDAQLVEDLATEPSEIELGRIDRHAAAEARPGEVEELLDHAGHALAAVEDA